MSLFSGICQIEGFFFVSLAIIFMLVLLLVYLFRQRINSMENTGNSMYSLLSRVVDEVKSLKARLFVTDCLSSSISKAERGLVSEQNTRGHDNKDGEQEQESDNDENENVYEDDEIEHTNTNNTNHHESNTYNTLDDSGSSAAHRLYHSGPSDRERFLLYHSSPSDRERLDDGQVQHETYDKFDDEDRIVVSSDEDDDDDDDDDAGIEDNDEDEEIIVLGEKDIVMHPPPPPPHITIRSSSTTMNIDDEISDLEVDDIEENTVELFHGSEGEDDEEEDQNMNKHEHEKEDQDNLIKEDVLLDDVVSLGEFEPNTSPRNEVERQPMASHLPSMESQPSDQNTKQIEVEEEDDNNNTTTMMNQQPPVDDITITTTTTLNNNNHQNNNVKKPWKKCSLTVLREAVLEKQQGLANGSELSFDAIHKMKKNELIAILENVQGV